MYDKICSERLFLKYWFWGDEGRKSLHKKILKKILNTKILNGNRFFHVLKRETSTRKKLKTFLDTKPDDYKVCTCFLTKKKNFIYISLRKSLNIRKISRSRRWSDPSSIIAVKLNSNPQLYLIKREGNLINEQLIN